MHGAGAHHPHGRAGALAFRIEDGGQSVVYASDAGYGAGGPPPASVDLYRGADLLIHDSTFTPEDGRRYADRGFSSVENAVDAAVAGQVKCLVLFHYDQDYSDAEVDGLRARGGGCSTNAAARGSSSSDRPKARSSL